MQQDIHLGRFGLFSNLTQDEHDKVRSLLTFHTVLRGDYVFMEGEPQENIYFLDHGLIKVFKVDEEGREQIINILGPNEMFPHIGFFENSTYPGTAQTLTDTTLLSMSHHAFEEILQGSMTVVRNSFTAMSQKIRQLQTKLQQLALHDAHQRVNVLLRHLAESHGTSHDDGIHIRLPMSHTEVAQMIGLTRESVNRIWNEYRRKGYLRGSKDEWVLDRTWLHQG